MEARGIDPTKRWRCVVRNHGQQQSMWQKTRACRGEVDHDRGTTAGPKWNQTFELRHSIEPATIVLVRVGSPVAAKKEVEVAYAHVPRLGLSAGKCSAFWVDLRVLDGKDAAEALGLAGAGWGDGDDGGQGTPRGGESTDAKVEGIKNAFAQASAGLKKVFGRDAKEGGGAHPGDGRGALQASLAKSASRTGGADDLGAPKILVRVGFAPKSQMEFVSSAAAEVHQAAPAGAGGAE